MEQVRFIRDVIKERVLTLLSNAGDSELLEGTGVEHPGEPLAS